MIRDDILKILNYAIWAPSGDNTQPWRFEASENKIKVFNVPEGDTSLYNFRQAASLVANGCLIENIKVAALEFGYETDVTILPAAGTENLVAEILLNKSYQKYHHPLFPYIKARVSNRKPYKLVPLSSEHKDVISHSLTNGKDIYDIRLSIIDGRKGIEELASLASVNEKIVLENRVLHKFLFDHLTWTEEEDKIKKGFFIKTLELDGVQKIAFKLFSHWSILKFFNKVGASNLVAKENAKLYAQSGAFVAISAPDTSAMSFIKSGLATQRFWLMATKLGLAVQPLTGILFLHHRIVSGDKGQLSPEHTRLIENAYAKIEDAFNSQKRSIIMMFRIGYAEEPSAKCLRRDPEIKFSE